MKRLSLILALATLAVAAPVAQAADPPEGVSGMAGSARVDLAWTAVSGATSYVVYRGTSAGSITTLMTPSGVTGTTWADTGVTNNTTYYYAVRSRQGAVQSANSNVIEARPKARSCSTGNATRLENCFPGDTTWRTTGTASVFDGGLEGFATTQSVDGGGTIAVKVNADWDTNFRAEIYRNGFYEGAGARLFSRIHGVDGTRQPSCDSDATTGRTECSDWTVSLRIPTTTAWPSGVYLLRLVREDTGYDSHILIVVRDDDRNSEVLYGVPFTVYQAYNNWGGKSLYDWGSTGANTVAGTTRAVAVSFDRPYAQVWNPYLRDWYTRTDFQTVYWLERMGYDVGYVANTDLERSGAEVRDHRVYAAGAHDEYWSAAMRTAVEQGRNNGTDLLFMGGNDVYWKVRFTAGVDGALDRTMVCYKSTQGGPTDPSGIPTGTWRDPAGINNPENALLGAQYVGDNDSVNFPLVVGAAEGNDRVWRFTGLDTQPAGTQTSIGTQLVGWEWNARYANGFEPAGVKTLASSPVNGALIQGNGAYTTPGTTNALVTKYAHASGALVFNAGTNNWPLGLALNAQGEGEPDVRIQQATTNVLLDMGATPSTPHSGITVSSSWPPAVVSTLPEQGDAFAGRTLPVTATFNRTMNAASLTASTFTLTGPGGASVPVTVAYDVGSQTASATPVSPLAVNTTYTAQLTTGVQASDGSPLAAAVTWSFTTSTCPCTLYAAGVTPGQTGLPAADGRFGGGPFTLELGVKVTVDSPTSLTGLRFYKSPGETGTHVGRLWNGSGSLLAQTTFVNESASGWQTQPMATAVTLQPGTTYVLSVNSNERYVFTNGGLASQRRTGPVRTVVGGNGVYGLAAGAFPTNSYNSSDYLVDLQFVPGGDPLPVGVLSTAPAAGDPGAAVETAVTATFSRALDAATVNTSTFTLTSSAGAVPATVTYDAGTRTARLQPSVPLTAATVYTARLDPSIAAADGPTLGTEYTWSFTSDPCPCSLFGPLTAPQLNGNDTQDGRWSGGPYSYELGVKVQVGRAAEAIAVRYYRDPLETGTHVGRIWSSTGTLLASVTFAAETASGWQEQALAAPLALTADTTYVVSVNRNAYYGFTPAGLASQVTSGPLRSVVGANGVYGLAAGDFPTGSYNSSNYYTDVVIR